MLVLIAVSIKEILSPSLFYRHTAHIPRMVKPVR